MHTIPSQLQHGPFTRAEAATAGVTSRMLQGRRFVRIHQGRLARLDLRHD